MEILTKSLRNAATAAAACFTAGLVASPSQGAILSLNATIVQVGGDTILAASFSGHSGGSSTDWIGVYRAGQMPGGPASTWWSYVDGSQPEGSLNLGGRFSSPNNSALGSWTLHFLSNDGYSQVPGATPVNFQVSSAPNITFAADQPVYQIGQTVTLNWAGNIGVTPTDWIGIFPQGAVPGPDPSLVYGYATTEAGTITFDGLEPGNYDVHFLANNGYQPLGMTPITVVPEPSTLILSICGLLMLRRRRAEAVS